MEDEYPLFFIPIRNYALWRNQESFRKCNSQDALQKVKEENGLIIRKEYPQISPKVEYSLTDKGRTLLPILKQVCDWGKEYCPKEK